jgi:acetoin utilization deacetylase AcuC-like enzyme
MFSNAMTTAYLTHPDCLKHDMGSYHPESPARLQTIQARMEASPLWPALVKEAAPLADADQLKLVHDPRYVDLVFDNAPTQGMVQLDGDTAMNPHSLNAARRAAGAGLRAVDMVLQGAAQNAFCAVRPCGHHATPTRAMGFCIFNNIAVTAAYALTQPGIERVAVIDFDVHHGNGTEDAFTPPEWHDKVLMASFFQHPFYPYSGTDNNAPNMVNLPVPQGAGGNKVRLLVEQHWLPALDAFKPDMVLISAGFDAHAEDDLGQMALVEADYVWMTQQLMAVADKHAQGRVVSMLEGGYNLGALARSVEAHVGALAGRG